MNFTCSRLIFLLAGILMTQGCGLRASISNEPINYTNTIQPLFKRACLSCHDAGSIYGNLSQYRYVARKLVQIHDTVLVSRSMPPDHSQMTEDERLIVGKWIDAGGPQ